MAIKVSLGQAAIRLKPLPGLHRFLDQSASADPPTTAIDIQRRHEVAPQAQGDSHIF
jgi:hypothetical protein